MKSDAIRVVINTPAKSGLFDYSVPAELAGKIRPGQMVIVPFNHRIYQGVVWQTGVTAEVKRLLPIRDLSDPLPVLTEAQLKLAEKIAERSLAPVHECVNLLLTDKIRRISDPVSGSVHGDHDLRGHLCCRQRAYRSTCQPHRGSMSL